MLSSKDINNANSTGKKLYSEQLTSEELNFFVRNGYFIKKAVISTEDCDQAIEIAWQELEKQGIPNKPEQWKTHQRLKSKMGVIKLRGEVENNDFLNTLAENPLVQSVVSSLIGSEIKCMGTRGLYPTFPVARTVARPYEPHIEMHPVQVFAMYYFNEVKSNNGGLYVLPGSHLPIYHACDYKFHYQPNQNFQPVYNRYNLSKPAELIGGKGDVIFLHHRILHSGSNNFADAIRFAMLVDYVPENFEQLRKQKPNQYEWEDWSSIVREAVNSNTKPEVQPTSSLSRAFALKLVHGLRKIRGIPQHSYGE